MKKITFIVFILVSTINLKSQTINVSDNLSLTRLSDNTYIHTYKKSNGIVFMNHNDALIVSTPDSDVETQNLIDWVTKEQNKNITGYIIDRWHPDAMEGLDIVHKNGIKSYSYELTRKIAKEKGLPIPQVGFDPKTEIQVGNETVICHFLGEAHTKDGIVVWIPSEQILFGGNEIRKNKGWVGNIADANIYNWSETAKRIKGEYGSAQVVIPGHGKHGGIELIDYTIDLYSIEKPSSVTNSKELIPPANFENNDYFQIVAESDTIVDKKRILTNVTVYVKDSTKLVSIKSSQITFHPDKKRFDSAKGQLTISDYSAIGIKLRTDTSYEKLILFKKDDAVGLRVILKKFGDLTTTNKM